MDYPALPDGFARMFHHFFRGSSACFVRLAEKFNFQVGEHFAEFFLNGEDFSVVVDKDFHNCGFNRVLLIMGYWCEMPFFLYCFREQAG